MTGVEWKPIETAPDNTRILLFCKNEGGVFVGTLHRNNNHIYEGSGGTYSNGHDLRPLAWCTHWAELPLDPHVPQPDVYKFMPSEFDARKWAKHWMDVIREHPRVPHDEETMVTWFANAIMAGYDRALRRLTSLVPGTAQIEWQTFYEANWDDRRRPTHDFQKKTVHGRQESKDIMFPNWSGMDVRPEIRNVRHQWRLTAGEWQDEKPEAPAANPVPDPGHDTVRATTNEGWNPSQCKQRGIGY